jgi:hypothetical protein
MALQGQSITKDFQFRVLGYNRAQHRCCREPRKYKEAACSFQDHLKCRVKDLIQFKARDLHPKYKIKDHNRYRYKGLIVSYRARDLHLRYKALPVKDQYHKISRYLDNQWLVLRDHQLHIINQEG